MQGATPSVTILAQMLSQLVVRFPRFLQRWLVWLFPRSSQRIVMARRSNGIGAAPFRSECFFRVHRDGC